MTTDFSSVQNYHESVVFDAVRRIAPEYPAVGRSPELLADVACVALNGLPPRYIRHAVDLTFYMSDQERATIAKAVDNAVRSAFAFVQSRSARAE